MGMFDWLRNIFAHTTKDPPRIERFQPRGPDRDDEMMMATPDYGIMPQMRAEVRKITDEEWEWLQHQEREDRRRRAEERRTREEGTSRRFPVVSAEDVVPEDVYGITVAIEYEDAKGDISARRITLHHLYAKNGCGYLRAFCHERQAKRLFRYDRILHVIDGDGVVHEPGTFFRDELRIDWREYLESAPPRPAGSPTGGLSAVALPTTAARLPAESLRREKSGMVQRRAARDGLRLLAALSRADGQLHDEELAVILDYIESVCERQRISIDDDDRAALLGYLKRQRPDEEVLDRCLLALETAEPADQRLFLDFAIRLAEADGVQDEAEFAMLMELHRRLGEDVTSPR